MLHKFPPYGTVHVQNMNFQGGFPYETERPKPNEEGLMQANHINDGDHPQFCPERTTMAPEWSLHEGILRHHFSPIWQTLPASSLQLAPFGPTQCKSLSADRDFNTIAKHFGAEGMINEFRGGLDNRGKCPKTSLMDHTVVRVKLTRNSFLHTPYDARCRSSIHS